MKSLTAAIIGAGPAGLIAAEVLAQAGARVTVYDQMASPGRKFLMAGRGGLNLTNSEASEKFLARYGKAAPQLAQALAQLTPQALTQWCEELGQPTFAGTSGRVFPKSLKASPLLRAWLARLGALNVTFAMRHKWCGFDEEGSALVTTLDGEPHAISADVTILAMGGASWPRLGSDGLWVPGLGKAGVAIAPLRAANCGFDIAWSEIFKARFAGQPLKNIALHFEHHAPIAGEAMITAHGLEGGAIYALSGPMRDAIDAGGECILRIDLKPGVSEAALAARLARPRKGETLSNFLRKAAGLAPPAIGLLREAGGPRDETPEALAHRIKALELRLLAARPIARAISTAGGLCLEELDAHYMIKRLPGVFAAGEMLDWDAPTGGYLLQACFATGAAAARGAAAWAGRNTPSPVSRTEVKLPPSMPA